MPGNPRKRRKRHLSALAKRKKNNELNFKMSKGRRDSNSDSQAMSNSQDEGEGEESTESLLKPTSLEDGNSHCSSAIQEDISFLPLTVDILPSHIFHTIDNTQDENKGSIESKQACFAVEDTNSHCNNPSQKDSLFSSQTENKMLSQTFQSISSTSQDKSERSTESPQEILLLGEVNSDCNNASHSLFLTNTKDMPSQTFCPDYFNLNFNMDEGNVKNLCLELDKTTILQNLEKKFSSLQLSPKQKSRKISSCIDLNTEKDDKLDPEENVITNISKQEINIEEWEEGQEIEVKVIEPTSIYLPGPSVSYEMTDGKYSYWSSVGLLTNKRRDPLYLGPDNEDLKKVFESAYNEEVIRLTSPTYIELEDLSEENILVECATEEVEKPLESENNEQVIKLTSPILIESDNLSEENPSLECETNTMDYIQYDLMDEISIGGENNTESLNNDETVERLQLKEKKKSFFGRLIGGIFGCFFNKNQKVR